MNIKSFENVVKLNTSLDLGKLRSIFVAKFRKQKLEVVLGGKFVIQTDFCTLYVQADDMGARIFYSVKDFHEDVFAEFYVSHNPSMCNDGYLFDYPIKKVNEPKEYRRLPDYVDYLDDVLLTYKSIVLLFMEDMNKIPMFKSRYTTKKKKKKTINQYIVTDEFLEDEVFLKTC